MTKLLRALAALSAVVIMVDARAGLTWDFSVCNGSTSVAGTANGTQTLSGNVHNTYACAANGSTTRDLSVTAWGAFGATNNTYSAALVSNQGVNGFGVGAQAEGGAYVVGSIAALDNQPTSLVPDLIVLAFTSAVILDQVVLGWSLNDADVTVMAYTGAGTPSTFIAAKTSDNLMAGGAGAGWSMVENAGDASPDIPYAPSGTNIAYRVNAGGVSSRYWLVSAYDSGFGGGTLDQLVDYTDLLSVSTREAAPIPEPSTFALIGAGLLVLLAVRTRSMPIPCAT